MDFRRILSDAGFSAFNRIVGVVTGILFIPVITRLLGADAYGVWITILAFAGVAAHVGGLYLYGSLIRFYPERGDQAFSDTLTLVSGAAVITSLSVLVGGHLLTQSELGIGFATPYIIPVGIYVGSQIFSAFFQNYFRAVQQVKRYEVISTVWSVIKTGALIGTFWLSSEILSGLWTLAGITLAFDTFLFVLLLDGRVPRPAPTNFAEYLSFSIPLVPKGIAGRLLNHSDKFLIIYFLGSTATGIYGVAYAVSRILVRFSSVFNATLFPNVSAAWDDGEFDQLTEFYNTFLRWFCVLAIPAIAGLSLLSNQVLRFLSTPEIASEGSILVPVLAMGFSFQAIEVPLANILAAAKDSKEISIITGVTVVVNFVINLALIPAVGLIGAAVATALSFAVRTGWTYLYADRYLDLRVPASEMSKSLLATSFMVFVLVSLPLDDWLLEIVLFPILGCVVFAAIFVSLGGIPKKDWERIDGII